MITITRPRRTRGFTLLEIVVVTVLIGLLLAFTLPKLTASQSYAEDSKAQTTASAALDAATQVYSAAGTRPSQQCADGKDRSRGAASPPPAYNQQTPSNCALFADMTTLAATDGDIKYVTGNTASPDNGTASVSAQLDPTGQNWRVAVAVAAPSGGTGNDSIASCWLAWREFAPDSSKAGSNVAPGGVLSERYVVVTSAALGSSVSGCSGDLALSYESDYVCGNYPTAAPLPSTSPSTSAAPTPAGPLGSSWRQACGG